jgi:hypothetical protein
MPPGSPFKSPDGSLETPHACSAPPSFADQPIPGSCGKIHQQRALACDSPSYLRVIHIPMNMPASWPVSLCDQSLESYDLAQVDAELLSRAPKLFLPETTLSRLDFYEYCGEHGHQALPPNQTSFEQNSKRRKLSAERSLSTVEETLNTLKVCAHVGLDTPRVFPSQSRLVII